MCYILVYLFVKTKKNNNYYIFCNQLILYRSAVPMSDYFHNINIQTSQHEMDKLYNF